MILGTFKESEWAPLVLLYSRCGRIRNSEFVSKKQRDQDYWHTIWYPSAIVVLLERTALCRLCTFLVTLTVGLIEMIW